MSPRCTIATSKPNGAIIIPGIPSSEGSGLLLALVILCQLYRYIKRDKIRNSIAFATDSPKHTLGPAPKKIALMGSSYEAVINIQPSFRSKFIRCFPATFVMVYRPDIQHHLAMLWNSETLKSCITCSLMWCRQRCNR